MMALLWVYLWGAAVWTVVATALAARRGGRILVRFALVAPAGVQVRPPTENTGVQVRPPTDRRRGRRADAAWAGVGPW